MNINPTIKTALVLFGILSIPMKSCQNPERQPLVPPRAIELDFWEIDGNDVLPKTWMGMSIKNNTYDTLMVDLAKDRAGFVYRSDVENYYFRKNDTLFKEGGSIRCSFGYGDSTHFILKGQSMQTYFMGKCRMMPYGLDLMTIEYNFRFNADSLDVKKYPQFKLFPCGNNLPIAKRSSRK